MSKEIAQTVGNKKVGLLLVLLAAFAVFATLGSQWRGAHADVTQASYTLTGPFTVNTCTTAAPASVVSGTTLYYCVTKAADATIINPATITVTVPTGLTITAFNTLSGVVPTCVMTTSSLACTYVGFISSSTGQLQIQVLTGASGGAVAGGGAVVTVPGAVNATVDDPGAQAAVFATNNTAALTIATATAGLTKSSAAVPIGGGATTQTITYTNTSNQTVSALTLTDAVPAGVTVNSVTVGPQTSSLTFGVACTATVVVGVGTVTCASTGGTATTGQTVVLTLNETVAAQGVATSLSDTANCSATVPVGGPITCTAAVAAVAVGSPPITNVNLFHVNEAGNVVDAQDVFNNVRGARHTACLFVEGGVIPGSGTVGVGSSSFPLHSETYQAFALGTPLNLTNIQVSNGGGFHVVGDQTPTFSNPVFFTGTGGNNLGASCFSWTSTQAGDQELAVVVTIGGSTSTFDFDTGRDGDAGGATGDFDIVKEWNVLTTSSVGTFSGGVITPLASGVSVIVGNNNTITYTVSKALTLNPATGFHTFSPTTYIDSFLGDHISRTGTAGNGVDLVGVPWTISTAGSTCGTFLPNGPSGTTTELVNNTVDPASKPQVVVSPGTTALTDCSIGSQIRITFTGTEGSALGSGNGNTVTEILIINFTQPIAPVKQVLLAWAGERVILEHDWRIGPGDFSPTTPAGVCPFPSGQSFRYVKAAEGPGNFVQGLGGTGVGPDELDVSLTGTGLNGNADNSQVFGQRDPAQDAPSRPQDACITRAIYESEDPGEVDVEVFADTGGTVNDSKFAFVIYYMKFNRVAVSLVTQVAKPSHNGSVFSDWADPKTGLGANPWDATKDAANATADWNVSKDILVRGRVSGWFVNSNPSGRERDATDPSNVLPIDRWVLPDDWALLAGGALANSFRPTYDLMFAPNNARGITMGDPAGISVVFATTVAAPAILNPANSATRFRILDPTLFATLLNGTNLLVGSTNVTLVSCLALAPATPANVCLGSVQVFNSQYYINVVGLAATPAVGTAVTLGNLNVFLNVPFEGPYSLIDIPGLAIDNGGNAGAALSNLTIGGVTFGMRDTVLGDSNVDWWDAPMPAANITVRIRGTGFIKQVFKADVYYLGTPNSTAQVYTNPYYITNVPGSPYIPAVSAGGGYIWDSWGNDGQGGNGQGVYAFWRSIFLPANNTTGFDSVGAGQDATVSAAEAAELTFIRNFAYGDPSISRTMVVFSDNHGEFMVAANGDFKTDLTACATNALAGGKLCKPGDKVGVGTVSAIADYPDFKKHFPIVSNNATINWIWGGYKDVTVEPDPTSNEFKYVVFHAIDRDGFCDIVGNTAGGAGVSLHPVLFGANNDTYTYVDSNGVSHTTPRETVDFLIDSGEGIILNWNGFLPGEIDPAASGGTINDGRQFATGVPTFDVAVRKALGLLTFPLDSPVMPAGTADECQAFVKVSNSLLGILNVLTVAHNDEGNEGFDKIIDLTGSTTYTLNFRWSLITWAGADGIPVADALKGGASTKNPGGNDISASVTAVYGWDAPSQTWLGFFPNGVNVPGANNLTALKTGAAYWIAITGPGSVTWTVTTNVGG